MKASDLQDFLGEYITDFGDLDVTVEVCGLPHILVTGLGVHYGPGDKRSIYISCEKEATNESE